MRIVDVWLDVELSTGIELSLDDTTPESIAKLRQDFKEKLLEDLKYLLKDDFENIRIEVTDTDVH